MIIETRYVLEREETKIIQHDINIKLDGDSYYVRLLDTIIKDALKVLNFEEWDI